MSNLPADSAVLDSATPNTKSKNFAESAKDTWRTPALTCAERAALRKCFQLLEIDKKRFALATLFGSGAIGSGVGLGAVSAWLIARAAQLPPVLDLSVAATGVRAFGVGKAIFRYLERIASHWVALSGMSAIRTHVYQKLSDAPIGAVAAVKRGDLLARTGADVDEIGDVVVKAILPGAVAIITSLISTAIVFTLSPLIGIFLAISLIISGVCGPYLAMRGARISQINQVKDRTELNVQALTLLEHAAELRISGNLQRMEAAQAATEKRIAKNRDRAAILLALAAMIDVAALGLSVVAALWIGAGQVANHELSVVNFVVVTLTPLAAFESTQRLAGAGVQLVRSAQAALRIVEMLGTPQASASFTAQTPTPATTRDSHKEAAETHAVKTLQTSVPVAPAQPAPLTAQAVPELVAKNLTIGWPNGPSLAHNINLKLQPGKTLAIVGASGIGKSTLLYTLAGIIPAHQGNVTLSGRNVSEIERKEISQHLILTAEDAHIFETSVLENLRVARADVTAAQATELLQRAGLGQWLAGLPDGVETILGADATSISGGERRRLLLARALAAAADFLLLDEPAEHLDPQTADQLIRDLLSAKNTVPQRSDVPPLPDLQQDATPSAAANSPTDAPTPTTAKKRGIILVTHRLSPLDAADEVILLGNNPGQIIARGTHTQLLESNAAYRWAAAQEISEN